MRLAQRATLVATELERAFPDPQVPLRHRDAFTLLVAVMLSARCTDARVNTVTPALFKQAGTPQAMAAMELQELRRLIATCGLADSKALHLMQTARILTERYSGQVPSSFEQLEALPGVGHKTASVVMNQAFGFPAFPVDTHIFRLARRWKLSRGNTVQHVEADLKRLYSPDMWGKLHLRFILWGRRYCSARGCDPPCAICSQLFPMIPRAGHRVHGVAK